MDFMKKRDDRDMKIVKIVLVTAGIVLAVAAATAVIYTIIKKHLKITVECEDCDFSEDEFLDDEDDGFVPEFVSEAKDAVEDALDEAEEAVDDIFDELD